MTNPIRHPPKMALRLASLARSKTEGDVNAAIAAYFSARGSARSLKRGHLRRAILAYRTSRKVLTTAAKTYEEDIDKCQMLSHSKGAGWC